MKKESKEEVKEPSAESKDKSNSIFPVFGQPKALNESNKDLPIFKPVSSAPQAAPIFGFKPDQ